MMRYTSNIEFKYEGEKKNQLDKTIDSVQRYSEFFIDICVQSKEIQKFSYSVQAVYSILAAREIVGVEPIWNPQLDSFTGLRRSQIEDKVEEVNFILKFID